jgi:hypothetical protein
MNRCPEHTLKQWPSHTQFLAEGLILLLNRPLYGLVKHLESDCVYGCCGMDAFDISASNAQLWLRSDEGQQRQLCLEQLDEVFAAIRGTTFSAYVSPLQGMLRHEEALDFFESIRSALAEAVDLESSVIAPLPTTQQ